MKSLSWIVVAALLSLSTVSLSAQEKALAPQEQVQDSEIETWIQDLASQDLDAREIAASKLLDLGQRAMPFLEKAVKNSKDTELRWNAKRLIREIREQQRPMRAPAPRGQGFRDPGLDQLRQQMEEQQDLFHKLFEEQREQLHRLMDPRFRVLDLSGGQGFTQNFSMKQGPDGVRIEITEKNNDKDETKVYEAPSVEEFVKLYPEIAEKYGIGGQGGQGFTFRFGHDLFPRDFRIQRPPMWQRLNLATPQMEIEQPSAGERLGVEIDSVEPSLAIFLDLPEGVGYLVRGVQKGSLAERMGIQAKDVLLSVNGKQIEGRGVIRETLRSTPVGAEVTVELYRANQGKLTLKANKEQASEPRQLKQLEKVEEPK